MFLFVARLQGFHQRLSGGWSTEGCGGSSKGYEGLRSVHSSHLNMLRTWEAAFNTEVHFVLFRLFVCLFLFNASVLFWTGTDENAIIELLGSRSNKQRVPMVAAYKTTYGKVRLVICQQFKLTSARSPSLTACLHACFFPWFRIWSVTWSLSSLETLRSWCLLWWWLLHILMPLNSEML